MYGYSIEDFAEKAAVLLENTESLNTLKKGALASAERFTIENMVGCFCDGITQCLDEVVVRS